ncbi:MAG TPA: hypothetical protein VGX03_08110 [Candidatus Binatia bacterium]|jgi:hypothetical protein|nr:hypothetical protein [Candidatus Binatia bacterium]
MIKKDAQPFLFIGVAGLGVSLLAVTVGRMGIPMVAALFTIGGLVAAAWQQWRT